MRPAQLCRRQRKDNTVGVPGLASPQKDEGDPDATAMYCRPAILEFLVQRWPDLARLPVWAIENATRRWDAPWVRVARIEIPSGQVDVGTDENLAQAERINFTPWRALLEHQPLGSINRARLAVYREMSAFRNKSRIAQARQVHGPRAPAESEVVGAYDGEQVYTGRSR